MITRIMDEKFSMEIISVISWTMGFVLSNIVMLFRQKSLQDFVQRLVKSIDSSQARRFSRRTLIMTILVFVFISAISFSREYESFSRLEARSLALGLCNMVMSMASFWILTTVVFYYNILSLVTLFESRILTLLKNYLTNGGRDWSLVYGCICDVHQVRETFENLFSILPLFWFGNNFASGAGILTNEFHQRLGNGWILIVIHDYIPPLLLLLIISHFEDETSNLVQESIRIMGKRKDISMDEKSLMMSELRLLTSLRVTGWSFFTMDKSFFLSYIGSVLTFAALFQSLAS